MNQGQTAVENSRLNHRFIIRPVITFLAILLTMPAFSQANSTTSDPRFVVPEGGTQQLLAFVKGVVGMKAPPRSPGNSMKRSQFQRQKYNAIVEACDLLQQSRLDDETEFQVIKFRLSTFKESYNLTQETQESIWAALTVLKSDDRPRVQKAALECFFQIGSRRVTSLSFDDRKQFVNDMQTYLGQYGWNENIDGLIFSTVNRLGRSGTAGNTELLIPLLGEIIKEYEDPKNQLRSTTQRIRLRNYKIALSRAKLLGEFMDVSGTTADEQPFDWPSYRGKIVAVVFFTSVEADKIRRLLTSVEAAMQEYGEDEFAAVGIYASYMQKDGNQAVQDAQLPWETIIDESPLSNDPQGCIALRYGVTHAEKKSYGTETTVYLVDRKGNIISTNAKGGALNLHLKKLFKPRS